MSHGDVSGKTKLTSLTEERLALIESGDADATITEVMEFARIFKRPFSLFFLAEPPTPLPDIPDKRTGAGFGTDPNGDIGEAIARAFEVHESISELASTTKNSLPEIPSPSLEQRSSPEKMADWARATLGIEHVFDRSRRATDEALLGWIRVVEKFGVVVLQETFSARGTAAFSIGTTRPPVVVLSFKDAERRRIFSLFHEVAHIILRQSAICDLSFERHEHDEKFCDRFAAAFLMPEVEVRDLFKRFDGDADRAADRISGYSGASQEAAFLRLVEIGLTSFDEYLKRKPYWDEEFALWQARQQAQGGGPNPNPAGTAIKKSGKILASVVSNAFQSGVITRADASSILRLPAREIPNLIRQL